MSTDVHDMLPPLPKIEGDFDLMLDVYTHHLLQYNGASTNNDYGNTERLAELGSKVFDMTVTYHFFSARPMIDTNSIKKKRALITEDRNLDSWLKAYGLKDKLRVAPDNVQILDDPLEMRRYFHTYIGALYIRNGLAPIQTWISRLIDPTSDTKLPDAAEPQVNRSSQAPPSSQTNYQGAHTSMGGYTSPSPSAYAPQPSFPPPPLPGSPPASVSSSMSLVTLALVNQTAAQRGVQIAYPAEQVGPSHQPTWTVRCCINGQEYGRGIGKNQKIAKEEAARKAWTAIGWGSS